MAMEERIDSAARQTVDRAQDALENASEKLKNGYDAARQYAQNSEVGAQVTDFVVREPWIGIAAAFAIGFVAARLIRRI
jgi:ElaB/YqjD/DUF883 family membrane-anchored ribosome-binding protein